MFRYVDPGEKPVIGVIGGSGVYGMEGLTDVEWRKIDSPFGNPSDELMFGKFNGQPVVFLPRHGRGHVIPPSKVNFRANIDALKRAGCTEILSLTAVGSLKEELPPGTFVIIDQLIDLTYAREKSFFGPGLVTHVSLAKPVCNRMGDSLEQAAKSIDLSYVRGGSYVTIEGPHFSTKAESEIYRSWKASVIGMTAMPEAKLAREAELCYANVSMVTDYDCWHTHHEAVTAEGVAEVMTKNVTQSRSLLKAVIPLLAQRKGRCVQGCHTAQDHACMTADDKRDPEILKKLDAVSARILA